MELSLIIPSWNFFYEEMGITQTYSAPRIPQQNGGFQWKNGTFIEAAMIKLIEAKLPTYLWAEAINIECYIQNICVVKHAQRKTII